MPNSPLPVAIGDLDGLGEPVSLAPSDVIGEALVEWVGVESSTEGLAVSQA